MKKTAFVILLLLVAVLCLTACDRAVNRDFGEEIIVNGTFEENGVDAWTRVASSDDTTSPEVKTLNESHDNVAIVGRHYLSVKATKYSGYTQTVALEQGQSYYLSVKVRIPSALTAEKDNAGAFVAIDSDYSLVSASLKTKTSEWKTIGVYFNSDTRTSAVVRFGVGTADYAASGTAEFDSVSLVKVESVPENVTAYNLSVAESDFAFDKLYRTDTEGRLFMILTVVLGALVLYAAYAAFRTLMGRKGAFLTAEAQAAPVPFYKSSAFFLIIVEILAFALRLILINFVYGGSQLGALVTESTRLADLGAAKYYYENTVLTPIGSLYLLWAMGALASPLKLVAGGMGFSIFLKIPAVLADLVIVFLIYYLANRRYNPIISAVLAGVYAVVPTFFFLSAGWGTYAPVGVLFILLSLISFADKKYVMGIVYYAIALLFSTEAMLLLPLLLVYLIYVFFKSDDHKVGISISLTSCIIGLYLISIPFLLTHFAEGHPFIVVKRYCQAFLAHTGFTENAFTIYGLFGLGASAANTASYVFNGILVALMMIYVILLFFKSKSRLDLMLLGAFVFVFTFVMTSAVDTLLVYFALALLLVYGLIVGDRRVLKLFGGLTLTTLINTSYAMTIGGYFGVGSNSALVFMSAADPVLIIFSIANLLLLAYFAYITGSICIKEEVKGVKIIEGNYFVYAWSRIKSCAAATKDFFVVKLPSLFAKKGVDAPAEDDDARKGQ